MQRWRLEFGADDLMTNFSIDEQTLKQLYPHGYHGVDKEFRPVYIERIGKTDMAKVLGTFDLNDLIRFHVRQWEILYTQQFPAIQKAAGRQVEQTICIIDLDGVSFGKHFTSTTKGAMGKLIGIDQDYFPEHLYKMMIINAPALFSGAWSFCKGLVDKRTQEKVGIFSRCVFCGQHCLAPTSYDPFPAKKTGCPFCTVLSTRQCSPLSSEALASMPTRTPGCPTSSGLGTTLSSPHQRAPERTASLADTQDKPNFFFCICWLASFRLQSPDARTTRSGRRKASSGESRPPAAVGAGAAKHRRLGENVRIGQASALLGHLASPAPASATRSREALGHWSGGRWRPAPWWA